MLAHNVFFALQDNSEPAIRKMVEACRVHLTGHPGIVSFACGTREKGLSRPVNDAEFDVSLHIVFNDKASHDAYQDAPRHHTFVEENRDNWAKVRVFDSQV